MSQCRECHYSNLRNPNVGTYRDVPYECLYDVDRIRYVFGDESCCHFEDKVFTKGDNSEVCRRCLILGGENCDECERGDI